MTPSTMGLLLIGVLTGIFAGFFGIGGGIVLVPALVWFLHMTQHQAQGLSLAALLMPVGLLGFLAYRQHHDIPIKTAVVLALGIFAGALIGGLLVQKVSPKHLKIAFGVLLILAGIRMIWTK